MRPIGWFAGVVRGSVEFCGGPRLAEAVEHERSNTKVDGPEYLSIGREEELVGSVYH